MIKIRFVRCSDLISEGIAIGERDGDQPTHVEVVMPDGGLLGAHASGGVAVRPAGYDAAVLVHELVVPISLGLDMTYAQGLLVAHEDKFYAFLNAQTGKPYDFTGVVGLAIGRDWREDDSWFCSELVARALEVCGFFEKLSSGTNHVSPRDVLLMLSSRLKINWATPVESAAPAA